MNVYEARSDLKKFKNLNGYKSLAWSNISFVKHLAHVYRLSEFEAFKAYHAGKIRVIYHGPAEE